MSMIALIKRVVVFTAFIFLSVETIWAQQLLNLTTTPVPFLRITPDARSGGMGDVGIATRPDAGSAYWNAGKLVFSPDAGSAVISYIPWLKEISNDVYFLSAAGFAKAGENQAFGLGVRYFSLGDIQFTTDGHNNLGSSRPREMSLDVTYSRMLSEKLGLGISARYIHSALASNFSVSGYEYKNAAAFAADIGLYFDNRVYGNGFTLGTALSNLGSKISYIKNATEKDFIPANWGLGASWNKVWNEVHSFSIAVDINKLLVPELNGDSPEAIRQYRMKNVAESWGSSFSSFPGQASMATGIEYSYLQKFAIRAGYYYESAKRGGRQYLSTGIGVRYNMFGFNFSYLLPSGSGVNQNPLSNTLRFSLLLHWDNANQ